MQVNSAQDYLTKVKKSVIAKSYYTTPPQQKDKINSVYTAVEGNAATQYDEFKPPINPGVTAANTAPIITSLCCSGSVVPGVFSVVNNKNVVRIQDIKPMSYRAT